MASVLDVAAYILKKSGSMTTWKLQKLVYYSQAWTLAWDDKPLFSQEIQAWADGPVCPYLYEEHRGKYTINREGIAGSLKNLDSEQKSNIDLVLDAYAEKSGLYLSQLTHQENPWKEARKGLKSDERGSKIISRKSMAQYYYNRIAEK
jgi:uncharacterized phage-associated protein